MTTIIKVMTRINEFYKNCKPSEKCHKNESSKMKLFIDVNNNKCNGLTQLSNFCNQIPF